MKLNTRALAIASAVAGILVYAFGAVMDATSAWGGAAVVSYLFRVDIVEHALPLTPGSFVMGSAMFGIFFGSVAACVAGLYNFLTRPSTASAAAPASAGR